MDAPKKNASRDDWAAYASTVGVDVSDEMGRDDIVEAVAAGTAPSTTTATEWDTEGPVLETKAKRDSGPYFAV